jgi:signal transduction histidine kinase
MPTPPALSPFGWLPPGTRAGAWRRLRLVWAGALLIALVLWGVDPTNHPMGVSLVYSFAISTTIWLLCDPVRIALRGPLRLQGPHYWETSPRVLVYLLLASSVGYAVGTALGDAYAGRSTWDLIGQAPLRLLGFWGFGVGVSAFFVVAFYHRAKAEDLKRQATEAQLRLLESQLEPHMLFNTLANLRVLIATDPPKAIAMLDRLNGFLRATLQASRSPAGAHTLAMEFDRLRDYLAIMAVRMGSRLQVALDLPPNLAHHTIPPLLLQPLVENAIQHGLEPSVPGGEVRVAATSAGNTLLLTVADTGVGAGTTQPTTPRAQGGFGLQQVRERLATAYGGAGVLHWRSAPGEGTTVTLELPLERPDTA